MDDNNKKPKKDENSNMNQTKEPSRTNETSTDLLENLQNLHNTLVDIVEPLQESNDSKEKLNLDESKSKAQTRKNIDTSLDFAQDLVAKMQEKAIKLIERDHGTNFLKGIRCSSNQTLVEELLPCDSTENFHKVVVLNPGSSMNHNIMLLDSTMSYDGMDSNQSCKCFEESDSRNDSYISADCSDESNDCESVKSNSSKLENDACALKEILKNIIADNLNLQFALNDAIKQNESMEISLKSEAPFKCSSDGIIRFPGKKKMEKKLLCMKTELLKLHTKIRDMKSIKLKLKLAQEYIEQYDATNLPCQGSSLTNDSSDTKIKVKLQQIDQIRSQLKHKQDELNIIQSDCKSCEKINQTINAKRNELAKQLKDSKKELKEFLLKMGDDLESKLNETEEEIETSELIIKERKEIISDCEQKMESVNNETSIIIKKTNDLEAALRDLQEHFKEAYHELQSVFQEQTEEFMMLPTILKVTHLKLQEETDLSVLAEETKKKLERTIRNVQENKKSVPVIDEQTNEEQSIAKLETKTKKLQSALESLDEKIVLASTNLSEKTEDLEALKMQIEDVIVENTKHTNAFNNFSIIHMDGVMDDIKDIHTMLMKLQSKECAKEMIKRKIMDHLREKIASIYQNINECKSQITKFKTN